MGLFEIVPSAHLKEVWVDQVYCLYDCSAAYMNVNDSLEFLGCMSEPRGWVHRIQGDSRHPCHMLGQNCKIHNFSFISVNKNILKINLMWSGDIICWVPFPVLNQISRNAVFVTQSCVGLCYRGTIHWSQVLNEDVVGAARTGDAPTTSEWSTILLPIKVWLISEVWWY